MQEMNKEEGFMKTKKREWVSLLLVSYLENVKIRLVFRVIIPYNNPIPPPAETERRA